MLSNGQSALGAPERLPTGVGTSFGVCVIWRKAGPLSRPAVRCQQADLISKFSYRLNTFPTGSPQRDQSQGFAITPPSFHHPRSLHAFSSRVADKLFRNKLIDPTNLMLHPTSHIYNLPKHQASVDDNFKVLTGVSSATLGIFQFSRFSVFVGLVTQVVERHKI